VGPAVEPASAFQRFAFRNFAVAEWSNPNVARFWRLRGKVPLHAVEEAVDAVVSKHEALRTTLTTIDGHTRQCIWPPEPATVHCTHVRSARSLDDREVANLILAEAAAPFDMGTPAGETIRSLQRVSLFRAGNLDEDHVLALVMDHCIADGGSFGPLDADFATSLAARLDGRAESAGSADSQFRDYARWERRPPTSAELEYWRPRLAPTGASLPLARDVVDTSPRIPFAEPKPAVEASVVRRLGAFAAQNGTPLSTAVFAAVAVAFAPWTGGALRLGVMFANRFEPAFQSVIGPMLSVLPLRIPLRPTLTFAEVLIETKREWFAALDHRVPLHVMFELADTDSPFSDKIHDVRIAFYPPRPQGDVVVANGTDSPVRISRFALPALPRVRASSRTIDGFPCAVTVAVDDQGGLRMTLDEDPPIVPRPTIDALFKHLVRVLRAAAEAPEAPIRELLAGRESVPVLD
jgi:hypothetical protein